jgi:hypothetical protein
MTDGMVYVAIAILAQRAEAKSTWDAIVLSSIALIFLAAGTVEIWRGWFG